MIYLTIWAEEGSPVISVAGDAVFSFFLISTHVVEFLSTV